jgi:pimeloyl-ACP methyl ester carboxylesterase
VPHATVDGRELHYLVRGQGEPLLMIQGMSGNHMHWGEPFLEQLERDFELVLYDHRGIGLSDRIDQPFTIVGLADDAAGLLDALGRDDVHVMGISMGGMVAQELALRHPGRVRTLVLGCTMAGGAQSVRTGQEVVQRLGESWGSGDRERILRTGWEVNVSRAYAGAHPAMYDTFKQIALEIPAPLPLIMLQAQAVMGFDAEDRLGEITAPTLVIHGTEDEMLSVRNAEVIAERIPGARLEILEGVAHLFFWEEPERSARLVSEFCGAAAPRIQ